MMSYTLRGPKQFAAGVHLVLICSRCAPDLVLIIKVTIKLSVCMYMHTHALTM